MLRIKKKASPAQPSPAQFEADLPITVFNRVIHNKWILATFFNNNNS